MIGNVKSDGSTLPSRVLRKKHWGKISKIYIYIYIYIYIRYTKYIKTSKNSRSSYYLQRSLTHRQEPPKHFQLHFFSLQDLWLLSYKQGYFWTATASSLFSNLSQKFKLQELLLFLVIHISFLHVASSFLSFNFSYLQ